MDDPQRFLEIGVVLRPHGVRGALLVRLYNPGSEALKRHGSCLSLRLPSGALQPGPMRKLGSTRGLTILQIEGIGDRTQAEALRGAVLLCPRESISLGPGEYLYADLVGCEVRQGAASLGFVHSLFEAGASDVLVVRQGNKERMIPLVSQWVLTVDLKSRLITLDPEGEWFLQPVDKEPPQGGDAC